MIMIDERELRKWMFKKLVGSVLVICVVFLATYSVGFINGQKSDEIQIKQIQQEATAQVEEAQQEADAKVKKARQEANEKLEAFEKKAIEKRDKEKYQMLEECMDGIPFPEIDFKDDSLDDEKILEYVEELKEISQNYKLSYDINGSVIYNLERVEKNLKEKIHNKQTLETIWELKENCEKNQEIWKN